MDDQFDALSKALATGVSRRRALKLVGGTLAGGVLAALGRGEALADECKRNGKKCKKNSQCCSGFCANGTCAACASGTRLCNGVCIPNSQCCAAADCPTPPVNGTATCVNGTCGFTCNAGYKACNGACIPAGQCCTDTDCGPSGNLCITYTCLGDGRCVSYEIVCIPPQNGTAFCDPATGNCVITCNEGYKACNGTCIPENEVC